MVEETQVVPENANAEEDGQVILLRTTIDPAVVTGRVLRISAGEVKGLRHDVGRGFVGAQWHARLARFVWLMGASDEWRTAGRTFEELCATLDTHILERIVPKCEPTRHPFLPDVTGRGWRADLGVQPADETQINRFTTWMTKVAALGALSWLDWGYVSASINGITERSKWNGHGASTTDCWMKAMARDRTRMALACATRRCRIEKRATAIQKAWRDHAYAAPSGCMLLKDRAGAGVVVGD